MSPQARLALKCEKSATKSKFSADKLGRSANLAESIFKLNCKLQSFLAGLLLRLTRLSEGAHAKSKRPRDKAAPRHHEIWHCKRESGRAWSAHRGWPQLRKLWCAPAASPVPHCGPQVKRKAGIDSETRVGVEDREMVMGQGRSEEGRCFRLSRSGSGPGMRRLTNTQSLKRVPIGSVTL